MAEMEKEAVIFETLPTKVNNAWILEGVAQIQMVKKGGALSFGELAVIHFNIMQNLNNFISLLFHPSQMVM